MPKSKAHQAVEQFYTRVKNLDYKYGYGHEELSGQAAYALETEFRTLLDKDSNNPGSSTKETQEQLLRNALNIVTKYEEAMKVALGTVNAFKLFINTFIGKEFFKIEGSVFSESYKSSKEDKVGSQMVGAHFRQFKEELENTKISEPDVSEDQRLNKI